MLFVNLLFTIISALSINRVSSFARRSAFGTQRHSPLLSKKIFMNERPYEYAGIITPVMGFNEDESGLVTKTAIFTSIILLLTVVSVVCFWIFVRKPMHRKRASEESSDHQLSTFLHLG